MGKELSAQKHLEQAMRQRDRMEGLPADLSISSEKLMRDAQSAMNRGDFESAKRISEDAESEIKKAREMRGDFNPDMYKTDPILYRTMENGTDLGESNVNGVEQEIQKSERMMENLNI